MAHLSSESFVDTQKSYAALEVGQAQLMKQLSTLPRPAGMAGRGGVPPGHDKARRAVTQEHATARNIVGIRMEPVETTMEEMNTTGGVQRLLGEHASDFWTQKQGRPLTMLAQTRQVGVTDARWALTARKRNPTLTRRSIF
jgi:hypothetical protein